MYNESLVSPSAAQVKIQLAISCACCAVFSCCKNFSTFSNSICIKQYVMNNYKLITLNVIYQNAWTKAGNRPHPLSRFPCICSHICWHSICVGYWELAVQLPFYFLKKGQLQDSIESHFPVKTIFSMLFSFLIIIYCS